MVDFRKVLEEQHKFSIKTFGPDFRPDGIINHIEKELEEIRQDPSDVEEWIDSAILSFDGAMKALVQNWGLDPYGASLWVIEEYVKKQKKNYSRNWPDWRTADLSQAIEHIRGHND